MKMVAAFTAAVLAVIAVGVGIVAAVWTPLPSNLTTPAGVVLTYLSDVRSGNCQAQHALIAPGTGSVRIQCQYDPTIRLPNASVSTLDQRQVGLRRVFDVVVTFRSDLVGWTGYAPLSTPPLFTDTWYALVGELPNGRCQLLKPLVPEQGKVVPVG